MSKRRRSLSLCLLNSRPSSLARLSGLLRIYYNRQVKKEKTDQGTTIPIKHQKRAKVILLAVSILASFILAEVGARVYFKAKATSIYSQWAQRQSPNGSLFGFKDIITPSSHPSLVYELIPNRYGLFQGLPYRTNSHGMRGPQVTAPKNEGVWRIAALGNSAMFAQYVREGRARRKDGKRLFYLDIAGVGRDFCANLGLDWERNMVLEYPADWHPSIKRHLLIARAIYLALIQYRLLPADSSHYKKREAVAQSLWDKARQLPERSVIPAK